MDPSRCWFVLARASSRIAPKGTLSAA